MTIIRRIFLLVLIVVLSFGTVYVFFRDELDVATRPTKVVTAENYTSNIKSQLEYGDTVQITGTPNLLQQVSQEGDILLENGDTTRGIQYYYVGLQEYGFDFVVRIAPGKLFAQEQTFTGEVTGLTRTDFGNRVKNSLNKPIDFEDSVNEEAGKEIDEESQDQIASQSEANYTSSSLLIYDNEIPNEEEVYLSILFWASLLSVFLATLFRKAIFLQ